MPLVVDRHCRDDVVDEPVGGRVINETLPVEAAHAVVGSKPQVALVVFDDRADHVVGQPLFGSKPVDATPAGPVGVIQDDTARTGRSRPQPQIAASIFQHRQDGRLGQTEFLVVIGEGHAGILHQPKPTDAHPEVAFLIFKERVDRLSLQPRLRGEIGKASAVGSIDRAQGELAQPILRPDPEVALPIVEQRHHRVADQARLGGKVGKLLPVEAADAPLGAKPELPLVVDHHRRDDVVDEPVGGRVIGEVLPVEAAHAVVGSKPQVALMVFDDRADQVVGQPLFCGERGEALPVKPAHARLGPDPQRAATISIKGCNGVMDEAVVGGIRDKLDAVVGAQAVLRPDP